jgi:sugar lactone lactonase YvrE
MGRLYVVNSGSISATVNVFPANAAGNIAPIATISGSNTALHNVQGVAVDAGGRLYVANMRDGGVRGDSITVFAANATGNIAPATAIAGSNTGLNLPWGIALAADGRLYVANSGSNSITIYAPQASGNITPLITIAGGKTGLHTPSSIALDAAGQLYVVNVIIVGSVTAFFTITVYAAGAAGNIAPTRTTGDSATGLPGMPLGLALDGACRLYVGNYSTSSVAVYAPDAIGNAAPIATVTGSNTGLSYPGYITF